MGGYDQNNYNVVCRLTSWFYGIQVMSDDALASTVREVPVWGEPRSNLSLSCHEIAFYSDTDTMNNSMSCSPIVGRFS